MQILFSFIGLVLFFSIGAQNVSAEGMDPSCHMNEEVSHVVSMDSCCEITSTLVAHVLQKHSCDSTCCISKPSRLSFLSRLIIGGSGVGVKIVSAPSLIAFQPMISKTESSPLRCFGLAPPLTSTSPVFVQLCSYLI